MPNRHHEQMENIKELLLEHVYEVNSKIEKNYIPINDGSDFSVLYNLLISNCLKEMNNLSVNIAERLEKGYENICDERYKEYCMNHLSKILYQDFPSDVEKYNYSDDLIESDKFKSNNKNKNKSKIHPSVIFISFYCPKRMETVEFFDSKYHKVVKKMFYYLRQNNYEKYRAAGENILNNRKNKLLFTPREIENTNQKTIEIDEFYSTKHVLISKNYIKKFAKTVLKYFDVSMNSIKVKIEYDE